ncbi:hypothetical protein [Streptomyces phaeoluteigriseus]
MNASTLPSLGSPGSPCSPPRAPPWPTSPGGSQSAPALASGIATLITARSTARTRAMWDRHEDTYLTARYRYRYRVGLTHIARVRQTATLQPSAPTPDSVAQGQQPAAEPSPAPP